MSIGSGISTRRTAGVIAALGLAVMFTTLAQAPASAASVRDGAGARLDSEALQRTLDAVVKAGVYGTYSDVRNGDARWRGASGVADIRTKRPMRPGMEHRIGSVTKTFTSVAVLQQVDRGKVDLDALVADYLPGLIPGERGKKITVRMLLNHTSGIGDYVPATLPSVAKGSPKSLDDNRFRTWRPQELVKLGLDAPPTGEPGAEWSYSNTNYIIAGLLLEKVTGTSAERYIERHVIAKAGLKHTYFPRTPHIKGPHSKAYESLNGLIDPPRDYSVYNMSVAGMAGSLISTPADLNKFFRAMLRGRLISAEQLGQMKTTVPIPSALKDAGVGYGLGILAKDLSCGRFWGHTGGVYGMRTYAFSSQDGRRQVALGSNLSGYERFGKDGKPVANPIDPAFNAHLDQTLCGGVKKA